MEQEFYFSAPGRTEISGNHTDHQHGCVLAAAIDMKTRAIVTPTDDGIMEVVSEGFPTSVVALDDLGVHGDEKNTSAALVRGVAAGFQQRGAKLGGFRAYVTSEVLPGSGLSSSAAFEVLIGRILNGLFCRDQVSPVEVAQIGQYAENVYFGKPCGLMDQMASSLGGLVEIDFCDPKHPKVQTPSYDFAAHGYSLCMVSSGADHANLTDEYASIPQEMGRVASFFGKEVLRDVDEQEFYRRIAKVRQITGDRATLRAMHFFDENRRVQQQVQALNEGDLPWFLHLVRESGRSSWMLLQNTTPGGQLRHQDMAFTLALCRSLIGKSGAVRVHGGGFAGTALAFVPEETLDSFRDGVTRVLGDNACRILHIL